LLLITVGEGKAEEGGRQRRDQSEVQAPPLHASRRQIEWRQRIRRVK
jgi:hypothetical protein